MLLRIQIIFTKPFSFGTLFANYYSNSGKTAQFFLSQAIFVDTGLRLGLTLISVYLEGADKANFYSIQGD